MDKRGVGEGGTSKGSVDEERMGEGSVSKGCIIM